MKNQTELCHLHGNISIDRKTPFETKKCIIIFYLKDKSMCGKRISFANANQLPQLFLCIQKKSISLESLETSFT